MTLRTAALPALAALALAGCGNGTEPAARPAPGKHNAAAYDTVDVCGLATDAQLTAALGEPPGAKQRRDGGTLKVCSIDGVGEKFYLHVTVQRSPAGARQQFDYDRSAAPSPRQVEPEIFAYSSEGEVHVEALNGELVVRVSFVYYADGGKVTDPAALTGRLVELLKQLTRQF